MEPTSPPPHTHSQTSALLCLQNKCERPQFLVEFPFFFKDGKPFQVAIIVVSPKPSLAPPELEHGHHPNPAALPTTLP